MRKGVVLPVVAGLALIGAGLMARVFVDRETTPPPPASSAIPHAAVPAAPASSPPAASKAAPPPPAPVQTAAAPAKPAPPPPPADPNSPPPNLLTPPPADVEVASLPPPAGTRAPAASSLTPATPPSASLPDWRRFAVPNKAPAGEPMIAIDIDDAGLDKRRTAEAIALPGPITIAFMAYADDLDQQTAAARAHGQEIIEHVPMEPLDPHVDPGPNALLTNLPLTEIRRRLDLDLGRMTGYVGINNHEGSKFTAYPAGMNVVMDELKKRGLLFVDSMTSPKSVGYKTALQLGVPTAKRDVFLDDTPDVAAVRRQLALVEQYARKHGSVIAIGHPKDATIQALAAWLPTLASKGFAEVPVSAVVAARMNAPKTAAVAKASRRPKRGRK